jgi:large subunit ribosomal protein L18
MMDRAEKVKRRLKRKKRIRTRLEGDGTRPRLCVYKSLRHMYAQLIDDVTGKVLTGASSLSPEIRNEIRYGGNVEAARKVGLLIGKKALELGITRCVFDRNGFKYHGRVKALADGAREAGLKF